MPASYDAELNLIFMGVAVPIPWGSIQRDTRGGDVLYTNSTLALNADTGEIVWYFQHIPGGNWDQDHPFERIVVETEVTPVADARILDQSEYYIQCAPQGDNRDSRQAGNRLDP